MEQQHRARKGGQLYAHRHRHRGGQLHGRERFDRLRHRKKAPFCSRVGRRGYARTHRSLQRRPHDAGHPRL